MFTMKPCVGFYVNGILSEDFDTIIKTIKTFFDSADNKPASFEDWVKGITFDKRNGEIRGVCEVGVISGQYETFFHTLVELIAQKHDSVELYGYYDVYGDNPMGNFSCFVISGGQVEWRNEDDVDIEFAAGGLMDVAVQNGYDFSGNLSLVRAISFLREFADAGDEDAQEAIEGFHSIIR